MSNLKKMLDKIDVPESSVSPLEVLQFAMREKELKRKKEERIFLAIQLALLFVLGYLLTRHLNAFVWFQLPVTLGGLLAVIKVWWKGERSHGN